MQKFFISCILSVTLLVGVPSVAQAQCLLCGIIGYTIGSSGGGDTSSYSNSNGSLIYVAPRLSERVREPLGVRFVSTFSPFDKLGKGYLGGKTIQQMFNVKVPNPDQFIILEVRLVTDQRAVHADSATFWFAYIEKEKVVPLESLPPPS